VTPTKTGNKNIDYLHPLFQEACSRQQSSGFFLIVWMLLMIERGRISGNGSTIAGNITSVVF